MIYRVKLYHGTAEPAKPGFKNTHPDRKIMKDANGKSVFEDFDIQMKAIMFAANVVNSRIVDHADVISISPAGKIRFVYRAEIPCNTYDVSDNITHSNNNSGDHNV